MTALAMETRRVRVGCLVFCMAYRNPALLANAAVTIDHVSGGRLELGLGCGWHQLEFDAYGIPFLPIKDRLDQLEEGVQIIRSLFENEKTTFAGKHFHLADAYCEPKPLQKRPRIWIGGGGEKRLLRMVARYADAWNTPFISPEIYAQKNQVLTAWCERERRDPKSILRTVNLGLALAANEAAAKEKRAGLEQQFGSFLPMVEPGMLMGTPQQVIDRIGEYERGGAEWVIVALRPPFDWEGYELFIESVFPAFGRVK
jgi:alkanesulfonate monooxygenase SsuD/methylene tetrahydromethanopterin reductase-like flavin-dependent oxidoreductase (luciferase family)